MIAGTKHSRETQARFEAAAEWVEDAALEIAVREVGDELEVRALTRSARYRVIEATEAAYGETGLTGRVMHHCIGWFTVTIDAAHRLAFARALSPIE